MFPEQTVLVGTTRWNIVVEMMLAWGGGGGLSQGEQTISHPLDEGVYVLVLNQPKASDNVDNFGTSSEPLAPTIANVHVHDTHTQLIHSRSTPTAPSLALLPSAKQSTLSNNERHHVVPRTALG